MSFSDRPNLSIGQKVGCVAYVFAGMFFLWIAFIRTALRKCTPLPDGSACEPDGWIEIAPFPVTLIVIIAGGILLVRQMTKD